MTKDQKAIRGQIAAWLKASKQGDMKALASILADDMTFIVVGQPAFGKKAFFAGGGGAPYRFKSKVKVREVNVFGSWAQSWLELAVEVQPTKGAPVMKLAGPTLTIWRKRRGHWQIWRDANLVQPA